MLSAHMEVKVSSKLLYKKTDCDTKKEMKI